MISQKIGKYYLTIYLPEGVAETSRLPVLYVLDGNAFSLMIAEAVKLQIRNSPKTLVSPMIIVGIGYQDNQLFSREKRFLDYTPPKLKPSDPSDPRSAMPTGGGIDAFFKALETIHEFIATNFLIDTTKIGLLGHSLGGLCVMEALIRMDVTILTDFLAISPSLWWDQAAYFDKLSRLNGDHLSKRRLILSVGEEEGDMVALAQRAFSWFENARQLQSQDFYLATNENHMSVVFTVMSRYLRWFSNMERRD